jgi:hypothetical protein
MSVGSVLIGVLQAVIQAGALMAFFGFLAERIGKKPIELTIESAGRSVTIKGAVGRPFRAGPGGSERAHWAVLTAAGRTILGAPGLSFFAQA